MSWSPVEKVRPLTSIVTVASGAKRSLNPFEFELALTAFRAPSRSFRSSVEPSIIVTNGKSSVSVLNVPETLNAYVESPLEAALPLRR